jgi:hypothetical protein
MPRKKSGDERCRKKFVLYKNLGQTKVFLRTVWVKEIFDGTRWCKSQILTEKPSDKKS